jgi:hypothetical protein
MTWRQAMQAALYGPGGFYARGEPPARHFRTSVHVSTRYAAAVLDLLSRHKAEVLAVLAATARENKLLAPTPLSERGEQPAEGEPGHEHPCAARRGRLQELNGVFLHFCVECGRFGPYGYGVRLRASQLGRWYCREHRPQN